MSFGSILLIVSSIDIAYFERCFISLYSIGSVKIDASPENELVFDFSIRRQHLAYAYCKYGPEFPSRLNESIISNFNSFSKSFLIRLYLIAEIAISSEVLSRSFPVISGFRLIV